MVCPKVLKRFSTIILLTIIFLQTFSSFVIQADYFLNKTYIARVLCINKEKPKMHCNGKCYLARQLKEQEKHDQQVPNPKREKFEVLPFFLPKQFALAGIYLSDKVEFACTQEMISSALIRSVFHPPTV